MRWSFLSLPHVRVGVSGPDHVCRDRRLPSDRSVAWRVLPASPESQTVHDETHLPTSRREKKGTRLVGTDLSLEGPEIARTTRARTLSTETGQGPLPCREEPGDPWSFMGRPRAQPHFEPSWTEAGVDTEAAAISNERGAEHPQEPEPMWHQTQSPAAEQGGFICNDPRNGETHRGVGRGATSKNHGGTPTPRPGRGCRRPGALSASPPEAGVTSA